MATFPTAYTPTMGLARASSPQWLRAQFNDEIQQAEVDGAQLNQTAREWTGLKWVALTRVQANEIDTFLLTENTFNRAFLWTPPGFSQVSVRCSEWEKTFIGCRIAEVTAKFREDFN